MAWVSRRNSLAHVDSALADERRVAILQAEKERQVLRQHELEAQSAPQNGPQVRITTWERLHALSLPQSSEHALVGVIARETGLTERQVRDEQGRRAGMVSR